LKGGNVLEKENKLFQILILILILVLPLVVLIALFLLLYTPVDFARYCFSYRRKTMKRLYGKQAKYNWLITLTAHYKIFELISKNDLPILFIRKKENPCEYGYFYYDHILFLADVMPHFDAKSDTWQVLRGHGYVDLLSYVETEKEDFYQCTGFNENATCERAVFLVKENEIGKKERDILENTDFIITYNKKNFTEKIKGFISKQNESKL
jgi:hypothetical protein